MRLKSPLFSPVLLAVLLFGAVATAGIIHHRARPAHALAPAPQPVRTFTLTFTGPEINYIAGVLQTRPYSEVSPLLNKMQQQINAQGPSPKGRSR